ncbi:hypothetical protein AN963_27615 [Brevibacillus choshinensis]|uniref:Uncharacterized protein n=1 Tax=Brevibacillus choshinensis TaxID=54911 RepID=A0ABR5N3J5_BRECH|nr:hypothetical protein [Brevibacillus choshinensis]KQL45079.1 hypothetical protein AN963_27615 [Brevibacillus choshinensis]
MGVIENLCVALIVIILLGTIGMTIYFHLSGRKKWTPHLLVGSLAIMFTLSLPLLLNLRSEHEAEIEKMIASREGSVLDIEAIMSNEYPMRRGKANTVYKVTYRSENNQTNTAWYRGINHIGNIHETVSDSLPEQWYFEEDGPYPTLQTAQSIDELIIVAQDLQYNTRQEHERFTIYNGGMPMLTFGHEQGHMELWETTSDDCLRFAVRLLEIHGITINQDEFFRIAREYGGYGDPNKNITMRVNDQQLVIRSGIATGMAEIKYERVTR